MAQSVDDYIKKASLTDRSQRQFRGWPDHLVNEVERAERAAFMAGTAAAMDNDFEMKLRQWALQMTPAFTNSTHAGERIAYAADLVAWVKGDGDGGQKVKAAA